jgi:phospholipase D1/2
VTILAPGRTCAEILPAPRGGLLIDGRDYYRAFYQAASRAERYLLIAAWQLDSGVRLLRGDDADGAAHPVELLPLLVSLCEARPELEIHLLAWDASSLFALEREPLQARTFQRAHPRIHYRLDAVHPMSASHHQKLVVVDRAVAFVGGMDLCFSRWDRRDHATGDPDRRDRRGRSYGPYHDIQCWLEGDAVDTLTGWFGERWRRATGEALSLPPLPVARGADVEASLPVAAERIGLARTQPRLIEPAVEAIDELRALHLDAIAAARQLIYVENQYLSSDDVHRALLARLAEPSEPPLEVVLILPARTKALKERLSLGLRQARILRELTAAAERGGHHLGAYYTTAPGGAGDAAEVYIHAKLLTVDDRFLLISSANLTNRSMGLDTELGVAWESAAAEPTIAAARVDLLREHTGVDADEAARLFTTAAGLVGRLDQRVDGDAEPWWRLRRHPMDEVRGDLLGRLLPDDLLLFDPDGPVFDDALHELTEGSGDATFVERIATAWTTARGGLARGAISDDEPVDGDDEQAEPSPAPDPA